MMLSIYRSIMDPDVNPLQRLPAVLRFQIMTYLSFMWTTIFCVGTGAWLWYGQLVILHVGIALGFVMTSWTFRTARTSGTHTTGVIRTYRNHPREDGSARYDDVWGA